MCFGILDSEVLKFQISLTSVHSEVEMKKLSE
jgi:hypothetical protein